MQRINALAKELKVHGIVQDFDEAYKKAEQMIERNISIEELNDEAQAEEPKIEPQPAMDPIKPSFVNVDPLDVKTINDRLASLEKQINQVFLKINEIVTEINKFEKKKRESPIEVKEEHKDVQANLKSQKVEPHPRTGDYKPEDVSIEKMFYFGRG